MFSKILIANRGEIAIRVIRACSELGVARWPSTARPTPTACTSATPTRPCASARPPAAQSYLVMPALIQAALQTGAEAIHPGYGFLAERAEFSRLCAASRASSSSAPRRRASSSWATRRRRGTTMTAAGVPVTPGSEGIIENAAEAEVVARDIGLPVMIKASAGGGGKGIRIAREASRAGRRRPPGAGGGRGGVRQRRRVRGEVHRRAAPHRDPGARRRQGARRAPRRARLQHPAAPPEAHRGGAVAGREPRSCGGRWARPPSPPPSPPSTRAPAPSSSCSTATAASTSWR